MSTAQLHNTYSSHSPACGLDNAGPKDYFALLKPRVMSLVVFSGVAGMWIAPGFDTMHPLLALISIFALALGAGAAGAVNMWYDRDIDALMTRTQNRPVPSGKVHPDNALTFAVVCSVASIILLGLASNWLAASVLAFANLFYSVFYTMYLKRRTPQNIVIGGAAGAFPPLIGWAAVTGDIALYPMILFAVIFFWTPPHFWALSLFANRDYARAGIPMLPVTHGLTSTRRHILAYTFILAGVTYLPMFFGLAGSIYFWGVNILNALFILGALQVWSKEIKKDAVKLFAYSIFYLFAYFSLVMTAHSLGT